MEDELNHMPCSRAKSRQAVAQLKVNGRLGAGRVLCQVGRLIATRHRLVGRMDDIGTNRVAAPNRGFQAEQTD